MVEIISRKFRKSVPRDGTEREKKAIARCRHPANLNEITPGRAVAELVSRKKVLRVPDHPRRSAWGVEIVPERREKTALTDGSKVRPVEGFHLGLRMKRKVTAKKVEVKEFLHRILIIDIMRQSRNRRKRRMSKVGERRRRHEERHIPKQLATVTSAPAGALSGSTCPSRRITPGPQMRQRSWQSKDSIMT